MRQTGQDSTLEVDVLGAVLTWDKWDVDTEIEKAAANAANAEYEQNTSGIKKGSIKLSGWLDSDEATAETITPGLNCAVTFTGVAGGPDLSGYGQQRIEKFSCSQDEKPGKWTCDIGMGYVDAERP